MILMAGMLAYPMKRTTVKIPDELDALLRHEAARRGVTISEVTREALESYLKPNGRRRFLSAGAGDSGGPGDISVRFEEILAEEGFGEST
jgi:plasmid stability protein